MERLRLYKMILEKNSLYPIPTVVGFRQAEMDLFSAGQSTQETIKVAEHCTELKVPEPIPQEAVVARNLGRDTDLGKPYFSRPGL